jgi:hypothetical protein
MKSLLLALMMLSAAWSPAHAEDFDAPLIWPTVRYGWPEKWSVGAAVQPRLRGWPLDHLIVSGTVGTGGHKVGLGYGRFGGTIMGGTAVHVTLLRTSSHPRGAEPHQTFIGVEPQIMLANWSFKGGPAVRVGGRTPSDDRIRINFSLGIGF